MIVEPDFLDHWKVLLLGQLLERSGNTSGVAALLVLRLWAHCQQRRAWIFDDMTDDALAAVCRFNGDGKTLKALLLQCKFIRLEGSQLVVHEWDVVNSKLVANWRNGSKGGRVAGTHSEPTQNPTITQPQLGSSDREEKIEKRRIRTTPPALVRVGSWFRRKPATQASQAELKALWKVGLIEVDDFALLEAYYTARIPHSEDYRRRDVLTLLNNWTGELDRARRWALTAKPVVVARENDKLAQQLQRSKELCELAKAFPASTEEIKKLDNMERHFVVSMLTIEQRNEFARAA